MYLLSSIHRLMRAAGAVALFAAAAAAPLAAQDGHGALNADDNGVMLSGYDAVAYQTESKPVKGSAEFTAAHDGVIYRFASAANRDAFKANPQKFAPAYGGYCAMGVAVGKKLPADPAAFSVVNGRLFLNVNQEVKGMWSKDVAGNNAKANRNWAKVKDRSGFDSM